MMTSFIALCYRLYCIKNEIRGLVKIFTANCRFTHKFGNMATDVKRDNVGKDYSFLYIARESLVRLKLQ